MTETIAKKFAETLSFSETIVYTYIHQEGKGHTAHTIERQAVTANPREKGKQMYKMTKEFYAPTKSGFSRKPYEVTQEVVTDKLFENYTDPAQTRFFNSFDGGYERRYPNGSYGCKIITVPPERNYRRVVRFKYTPRA